MLRAVKYDMTAATRSTLRIEARFLYFSRCVFEVAVVYKAIVLSVEVWVMSGYLGEVRVRRTSEGLR